MTDPSRIIAVLGPTNTGKTHYAIERMLGYKSGVIGLPLRLLAREVYDRIVALRGSSVVALVTGEERIVPKRAQYWVATVEAMPSGIGAEFVAIDEIQLCADPDRGHIFTERLLSARGQYETLFLGSDTMRSAIAELVPKAQFLHRERFSELSYTGAKKISRMGARSAIVGFSVENVYAIAELLRRQKGGAAVVMGALSPRTRNAQVELYQNGDVDYLVATDAIGMGLNLDIKHVAFSGTSKFDGRRMRALQANELAQIAGRAGRHMNPGTFGTTGEAAPLPDETVEAIVSHRFPPVRKLYWRSTDLNFSSLPNLIASLETRTDDPWLTRVRESDDLAALKNLASVSEVSHTCTQVDAVKLLWDVCRIPDFRAISPGEHASLLEKIYLYLQDLHRIPDDWLGEQIKLIDRTDGDIDTLSKRLAFIRTWTYVAQRKGWVDDETHWRGATRIVEDRLSDALHNALTQRFVDRRTSVLLRRLNQKEGLVASVNDKGEVSIEDQFVGRLQGFRFIQDPNATPEQAKTLRAASLQALKPEFHLRADRFYNAPDTEIDYTEQGGLMWGEHAVGKLVAGPEPLKPVAEPFVDEEAGPDIAQKVQRRLQHFIDRKIATLFEPLLAMGRDETLTGLARGFAFRLGESFGVVGRDQVLAEVKELDQDARSVLRKHGIRFGQYTIFMPILLKPAATRLRLLLWSISQGHEVFPESPPPGLVTIPTVKDAPKSYHTMSGFRQSGARAIRIDMLERLADLLRAQNSRSGFEANPDMLSITGMTLEQFADLMQGLGYKGEKDERLKVKASADVKAATSDANTPETVEATVEPSTKDAAVEEAVSEPVADATPAVDTVDTPAAPVAEPEQASVVPPEKVSEPEETEPEEAVSEKAPEEAPEMEVFYTFTWAGNRGARRENPRNNTGGAKPTGKPAGKYRGKPREGQKGKPKSGGKPQKYAARPPRPEKKIDPDNPFAAALMGFKDKS